MWQHPQLGLWIILRCLGSKVVSACVYYRAELIGNVKLTLPVRWAEWCGVHVTWSPALWPRRRGGSWPHCIAPWRIDGRAYITHDPDKSTKSAQQSKAIKEPGLPSRLTSRLSDADRSTHPPSPKFGRIHPPSPLTERHTSQHNWSWGIPVLT